MKKSKEIQFNFNINVKPDNSIATIKKTWNKTIITASAVSYFRSLPFVLSAVFNFLTFFYLAIIIYKYYPQLPLKIPLIYSQALVGWNVVDKIALLYFLGIFLIFSIVLPGIKSKIYFFDKRLVLVISIGEIIIDCFILIAFSEIFSLLLH